MKFQKNLTIPVVAAILLSAIFAFMVVVAKELSETLSLQQQVYGRSFIALILVLIIYRREFVSKKLLNIPKSDAYLAMVRGLVLYVGAIPLISYAAIHSTVFLAAVLGALPFAALYGIIFFKERLTFYRSLAMVVACLGVVAISNPLHAKLHLGAGEWAAIASSALFAAAYVTRRLQSHKINNPQMSGLMYLSGTLGLLLLSLLLGQGLLKTDQLTLHAICWLVIGGVLNLFNIMLVNYVFHKLPAITANILLTTEFVFAIIFGYLFYVQIPLPIQITGTLMIIGSIILLAISENRKGKATS